MSPGFFYTPNKQKTRGSLMFSGGVEWVDKEKKKKNIYAGKLQKVLFSYKCKRNLIVYFHTWRYTDILRPVMFFLL